ncbi:MAG TPA: histidine phosphatase family protein [Candidatus Acidoferrales bacterium]|nr:histidine phosphatase family protein [Candidatus Acidoferrales bacterium]
MEILLLRHAETDWNLKRRCQGVSDLDLNESGVRQAREIGESLRHEPIRVIVSSDLKRARQTAAAVRRHHPGVPLVIDRNFRELDHGDLEGLTFDEVRERYPEFMAQWRVAPARLRTPGGESLAAVAARAWAALEGVARRWPEGTAVVVTHNFPILSILCRVTGTDLNDYRSFRIAPCALARIGYEAGQGWRLLEPCASGAPDKSLP